MSTGTQILIDEFIWYKTKKETRVKNQIKKK